MGVLDQVTEMRQQGLSEAEMSARLQEQGISPREINDAFNQERIKSAVSAEDSMSYQTPTGQVPGLPGDPSSYQNPYQEEYQQDPYQQQNYDQGNQGYYPDQGAGGYEQGQYYQEPSAQGNQGYYPDQGDYSNQEGYSQDPYSQEYYPDQGAPMPGYNTDTIIEISEQVFAEKIKKIEKQVEQFAEFAALAQTKIANNNERVKRIESIIDKLQISILDKVGSYGKDIQSIKKEMEMIEDSFTKVIPELKKNSHSKTSSSHKKSTSHKK